MSAAVLKVSTEARPSSRLAVTVSIPGERSQASYEEAITTLSQSIKIPGFRKGKIPRMVLVQQVGTLRIKATAMESLVDQVWRDAIKQESLEPISQPELSDGFEKLLEIFNPGDPLTITLEADVAPTPILKATTGLNGVFEPINYDPSKVEEMLENYRKELATIVPVENRAALRGDIAVISFTGKYNDDDSEIDGGSSDSMDVDLENDRMIPGFIEGVVGMNIGEQKLVNCQFPDDYPKEDARGRKATFTIKLKDLKTRELPALDNEFAKQAGKKETLEEFRCDLEKRLKDDAKRLEQNNRQDALINALVEQLEVDLPEALIQQESRNLLEQTATQFAQQGMDVKSLFTPDLIRKLMQNSRPEAEERLRRSFALTALATAEKIKVSEKEVETQLEKLNTDHSTKTKGDPKRLRQSITENLMKEKLMGWLEENTTLIEQAAPID